MVTALGISAAALGVGWLSTIWAPRAHATDRGNREFKPIKEAELPRGFPGYTPVGEIEVKHYPAYRKATASGMTAFWTLFGHIKQNKIEMTAPVELTYGNPDEAAKREREMAFLYGEPDMGKTGKQGSVDVEDVPAMTVVSIGMRGPRSGSSLDEAQKQLQAWLKDREAEYRAAGPMRVMGYNSPFVPRDKNFWEVQIPIAKRAVD